MDIDLHAGQGVNQRQRVRAPGLGRPGHLRDIRHIGAQLHDHRLARMALYLPGDGLHRFRILAEGNAAFLHIRAGNIDLHQINRLSGELFHHIHIVRHTFSAHIDNDFCVKLFQERDIPPGKQIKAGVLQANGIEHAAVDLRDARRGIARPRHVCHALCHHRAQPV